MLVNLEPKIDYTKLPYQSVNRNEGPFNFYEFGSNSKNQLNNL